METRDVLTDAYTRIQEIVHQSCGGLGAEDLAFRPEPGSNSIAWLVWHLTRTQDHHVAEIAGRPQAWIGGGWAVRFDMAPDPDNTGFGHTPEEVAAVRPEDAEVLLAYHHEVAAGTLDYLESVGAAELDRIIDHSYDPPVSVGVRLVSVISDNLQHAGQARYLRGMIERLPAP